MRLTFADKLKILQYLQINEERFKHDRPLYTELAEQISRTLNVPIRPNSLRLLIRDARIDWQPRIHRTTPGTGLKARITRLETLVEHLYDQLACPKPTQWHVPVKEPATNSAPPLKG